MVTELKVSGAFHSPLMQPAADNLAAALEDAPMTNADFPVYLNVTAKPATDAGEIRARLLEQLTSPVRWTESVKAMISDGATRYIEVGPGSVLSKLMKRIDRSMEGLTVGNAEGVKSFNPDGTETDEAE
jgi:[acyl-carrier-protein] S-malonyltransferase